ncbi:MAG TPA: S9 family peptidase [Actinomycetota bacterium]|nr:S9 family peptidase [Actinomycetota bacterium]
MRGMTPEDVNDLVAVADPRVSPDGRTAAYVLVTIDKESAEYRSAVWVVPLDGSAPPRRFTSGSKRDSSPRWSPDGSQLAFTSSRESDAAQLFVIPASGGEAVKLTDLKEDVAQPVWSPDGSRIAFTSRVRDAAYEQEDERKRAPRRFRRLGFKLDSVGWTADRPRHVFVVQADGSSEPVQLTDGDHEDSAPTWAPDSRRLAFVSARHEDWDIDAANDIYIVDAGEGDVVREVGRLTATEDQEGARVREVSRLTPTDAQYSNPSWSPDGSLIACGHTPAGFDFPRHGQIAVVDASTGRSKVLTASLDRNCEPYPAAREPIWAGDRLLFGCEDHGNTHLYMVPADGSGQPEPVVTGELRVAGYDLAAGMGVHVATTVQQLPELWFGDRRLTDHGSDFTGGRALSEAERFVATSADGSQVDAWIMRPVDFEEGSRYPVLLNIHGGPFTQYGNGFLDEFHVYTAAGYVVVYSNPRGSSGYSEEWGRAIRGPANEGPGWGTRDYEDLMAVTDEALSRYDFCDPDRVGVIGGSYGGYMTTWIVGHTKRFAAACSERAVNNWVSMYGSSDAGWIFKGYIGSELHEDVDTYVRLSPSTYAPDITTPLLILHSENDLRCPVEQGEHLFTTLRLLKRDVELVRFPAESHELSRSGSPAHRVMRFEAILEWFGRYLRPETQAR